MGQSAFSVTRRWTEWTVWGGVGGWTLKYGIRRRDESFVPSCWTSVYGDYCWSDKVLGEIWLPVCRHIRVSLVIALSFQFGSAFSSAVWRSSTADHSFPFLPPLVKSELQVFIMFYDVFTDNSLKSITIRCIVCIAQVRAICVLRRTWRIRE